jgi:hypothetical protein
MTLSQLFHYKLESNLLDFQPTQIKTAGNPYGHFFGTFLDLNGSEQGQSLNFLWSGWINLWRKNVSKWNKSPSLHRLPSLWLHFVLVGLERNKTLPERHNCASIISVKRQNWIKGVNRQQCFRRTDHQDLQRRLFENIQRLKKRVTFRTFNSARVSAALVRVARPLVGLFRCSKIFCRCDRLGQLLRKFCQYLLILILKFSIHQ